MTDSRVKLRVVVAENMAEPGPIELHAGGTVFCMTAETVRELINRLEWAATYAEDWRAWRDNNLDCN